ncbi:large ribosomal subunit protein eL14 isoform X2 [Periplaneta americana]|uniref:large ribosomal subunit protein eL14 isoform X1 n=1 Tax=Periplaneta americana TaxID=6978 RepID=UPI0037E85893
MPFERFVETGRVAYVADGPYRGKLCSIVDVIDQTRALVDGPETGVPRGQMRLNQLHLTKFKIKFPFTDRTKAVRKAWQKSKIDEKWAGSQWAQKIEAKRKRRAMTDFDRFKLRKARQIRNKIRTVAYYRLKKRSAKDKMKKKSGEKNVKKESKEKKAAPKKK